MARTVTPAISAALGSVAKQPNISVVLRDLFDRPDSSAAGGASGRSAFTAQPDGAGWVRAYVTQPGIGLNASVYTQLITDPADTSQLSSWSLRSGGAAERAGVCTTVFGSTIFLFYQRRSDLAVCYQSSADGITWSAESVATSPGLTVYGLASAGTGDLFQVQDVSSGDSATQTIGLATYASGSFTATSSWTNPNGTISGLSAAFDGTAYRLVLGAQTRPAGGTALSTLSYAAGAWGSLDSIHPIDDPATGLSMPYPGLMFSAGEFCVAAVLYDSGSATGVAGQRCELWRSPDFVNWRLEQNLPGPFEYGAWIAPGSGGGWMIGDASTVVLSALAASAQNPDIDVSGSVLALRIDEPANDQVAATLVLDNHDGRYSPSVPPTGAMRVAAAVDVALGYGGDAVRTHRLLVDAVESTFGIRSGGDSGPQNPAVNAPDPQMAQPAVGSAGGGPSLAARELATVTIHLSNRASRLANAVPVERIFAGETVLALAKRVAVAGGFAQPPASPGTAQFAQTIDRFALSAATAESASNKSGSFRAAFDRLRSLFGFDWFVDENELLQLAEPQAVDAVTVTYNAAMPVISHSYAPVRTANQIRAAAPAAGSIQFADAVDTEAQAACGEVSIRLVTDRLLQTSAQAQIRAALELRRAQRDAVQASARIPLNPALQPLDVIAIEDESLSATFRIERILWYVDLTTGAFEQTLTLRNP